ncbi:uncharacterized protein N7484_000466 [Penicillium longicatenatum]|uniref:uncharacterized protein n=1 Tax=Penicillium longicatenatum TaxID=1561947 RepID=UPI0025491AE9|nr:uncharacterized protein N7484_000466 [Penicillium longicatenatum]KAJ5661094.1 hypothetical protein N7484_000466 [Penicillium longicatenatum]
MRTNSTNFAFRKDGKLGAITASNGDSLWENPAGLGIPEDPDRTYQLWLVTQLWRTPTEQKEAFSWYHI